MKIKVDGKEVDVKPGETFVSGGRKFGYCSRCRRIIRFGLFGSLHVCAG